MSLIGRLKGLLAGLKPGDMDADKLETIANEIIKELNDVIIEIKNMKNKWTWKIWKSWELYKPLIKQVVELLKEVGEALELTGEQKKGVAELVCWKIIEPLLPIWAKFPIIISVIRKGINKGIDVIYQQLKSGEIKSEVFVVASVR